MPRIFSFLSKSILGTVALGFCLAASAYTFTRPFSHFANNTDLKKTLVAFAQSQGLKAVPAPDIRDKISGRFNSVPASYFMKAMEEAYGIGYYVLGKEIHFYLLKNQVKRLVPIREGSAEPIIQSLESSNIISADLPVDVNSRGTLLTIMGPASYADQIKSAVRTYEAEEATKIVMRVFKLKHAWAEDVELSSMDKTVTVPGVASILRAMVMGQSVSGQTVTQEKPSSVKRLGAKGVSRNRSEEKASEPDDGPVTSGSISIMADPRVNAVLVSDIAYRMPYYKKVIEDLDKPVELVEIHAAIVDVDTSANLDLGINYGGANNTTHNGGTWRSAGYGGAGTGTGRDSISSNGNDPISSVATTAGLALSTIYEKGTDFFMARINALESDDEAKVLGRPSILTVDNVQATLENTTTYYVKLEGQEAVDLVKVDAGTVLRVTPHIIRENGKTSIRLLVNVQDDQGGNSADFTASKDVPVPPIKQTKINTQAVVDVGQSLLIGGYYYEQKNKGTSGVPFLKDIPLLGYLFRSTSKSSRRMERLILITPRIVASSGGNSPARVATPEFQQSATQADYEDQHLKERK